MARKRGRVAQKKVASLARFLVLGRVISLSCPPVHRSSRVHPSLQTNTRLGVGKGGRLPQHKDLTRHPVSSPGCLVCGLFFWACFELPLLVHHHRLIVTIQMVIIICTYLFRWSHHHYFTLHIVVAVYTAVLHFSPCLAGNPQPWSPAALPSLAPLSLLLTRARTPTDPTRIIVALPPCNY